MIRNRHTGRWLYARSDNYISTAAGTIYDHYEWKRIAYCDDQPC